MSEQIDIKETTDKQLIKLGLFLLVASGCVVGLAIIAKNI